MTSSNNPSLLIAPRSGLVIEIEENPGYPDQKMYILEIDNYAIIAPYVENDDEILP